MKNILNVDDQLTVVECFERLTKTWTVMETDPETGEALPREMPALLLDLREAVFGGMESTGGRAGFRPRMPISDGALDLYETIDMEISEAWACSFPGQIPNADTPERLLSQLVAVARPDEIVEITVATQRIDNRGSRDERWWVERVGTRFTIAALLRRWVHQITDFFNPPRTREIKAPCIQCGEEWGWKNPDGEDRPYRVFVFVHDDHGTTMEARCLACGMSWGRDKLMFLAAAIGATDETIEH